MNFFPSPIADALQPAAWALVHFLWQGTLAAFAVAGLLRFLRGGSARQRYLAALIGLAVMALSPLVTAVYLTASAAGAAPAAEGSPAVKVLASGPDPARLPVKAAGSELLGNGFEPFLPWLVAAWLLGVVVLTLAHVGGWRKIRRLRRESSPAPGRWEAALDRLAKRLGVARPVELLESARVRVPVVLGWIRPAILVPASTFTGLSPQQLEAVLAHELAHVRRHDYLVNLCQIAVETLLFYHPGVWWVSRQVRVERENCCDDLAVGFCASPLAYARALAGLEELRFGAPALALGADGGSLLGRIRRLVSRDDEKPAGGWLAAMVAALVATLVAVLGVALIFLASSSNAMPAAGDQGESAPAAAEEPSADAAEEPSPEAATEPDDRWNPGEPSAEAATEPDDRWNPGEPRLEGRWARTADSFQLAWAEPQEDEARPDDEDRRGRRRVRWWRLSDDEWIAHAVEDLRRAAEGTPYESLTEDDLGDLARHGFEPELFPALVDAEITDASPDGLEDLARHGIDAEDFREYHGAGFPDLSIDDVVELARHGVDGDDVRDFTDAGLTGVSVGQIVNLARHGIDGDDVHDFHRAGFTDLSMEDLVDLARHGVDGDDAEAYKAAGLQLSVEDMIGFAKHGIDGGDVQDFQEAGHQDLSVQQMIELARNGIDGGDARDFREAGYDGLSAQQMIQLARNGIDGGDVQDFQEAGFNLSVEQMIDLARNGIDGGDAREFREAGYDDLSVEQMIDLARNGIDGEDLKAVRDAGHDLSVEEVIQLARRGRLDDLMYE